jgi:hypothetical protein
MLQEWIDHMVEITLPMIREVRSVKNTRPNGIVGWAHKAPLKLEYKTVEQHVLEALRKDEEFVLYRGENSNQSGSRSFLLLVPVSPRPVP